MKVSEILLEMESEHHPRPGYALDDKQVLKYMKQMTPDVIHNLLHEKENFVFRGTTDHLGAVFSKSSVGKRPRRSANTSNEFTVLTSQALPSWKKYPRRDQSFVCTTSREYAQDYGKIFHVFPLGDPDFGVCPKIDIWNSFKTDYYIAGENAAPHINLSIQLLNQFAKQKVNLFAEFNTMSGDDALKLLGDINDAILSGKITADIIDEEYKVMKNYFVKAQQDFLKRIVKETLKNKDIIKTYDELLDPEANGFQLLKFPDVIKSASKNVEVWFKGEALFVQERYLGELRKIIKELQNEGK
jgi:hypothetical protein